MQLRNLQGQLQTTHDSSLQPPGNSPLKTTPFHFGDFMHHYAPVICCPPKHPWQQSASHDRSDNEEPITISIKLATNSPSPNITQQLNATDACHHMHTISQTCAAARAPTARHTRPKILALAWLCIYFPACTPVLRQQQQQRKQENTNE